MEHDWGIWLTWIWQRWLRARSLPQVEVPPLFGVPLQQWCPLFAAQHVHFSAVSVGLLKWSVDAKLPIAKDFCDNRLCRAKSQMKVSVALAAKTSSFFPGVWMRNGWIARTWSLSEGSEVAGTVCDEATQSPLSCCSWRASPVRNYTDHGLNNHRRRFWRVISQNRRDRN